MATLSAAFTSVSVAFLAGSAGGGAFVINGATVVIALVLTLVVVLALRGMFGQSGQGE